MSPSAAIGGYTRGETIAALSSRAGQSARSVLRTSGEDAFGIGGRVFNGLDEPLEQAVGGTVLRGWLRMGAGLKCPCLAYLFRGPHSYTGEDVVEYHLPGGAAVAHMALAVLMAAGARAAEPGEFTLRAFLAGRMDLAQAEAVAAIIGSQTDAQLQAANSLADGVLSRAVGEIQDVMAKLMADVEANIDFVDQDIEFVSVGQVAAVIEQVLGEVRRLMSEAVRLRDLQAQPRVVLAGAANVGKSTLLNALTGLSRAIVSGVAGTTRDVLMAPMKLEGAVGAEHEVLLVDAAGLCDSALDDIAAAGRAAALRAVGMADLVGYVVDGSAEITEADWQRLEMLVAARVVIVVNKIDLLEAGRLERLLLEVRGQQQWEVVGISAKTGEGLDGLREQMGRELASAEMPSSQGRLTLTVRAEEGLAAAQAALGRAAELVGGEASLDKPELLAVELYEANAALGEITGQITSEDVLADIFSRFCVGK